MKFFRKKKNQVWFVRIIAILMAVIMILCLFNYLV